MTDEFARGLEKLSTLLLSPQLEGSSLGIVIRTATCVYSGVRIHICRALYDKTPSGYLKP